MKNKKRDIFGLNSDFLGIMSSLTCAVHCMALPLLASVGLLSTGHHNHVFDFVFFSLGLLFAGFSLFSDFRKHGYIRPVIIGVLGFMLLLVGILGHLPTLSVIGGLSVAAAHIINFRHTSLSCKID